MAVSGHATPPRHGHHALFEDHHFFFLVFHLFSRCGGPAPSRYASRGTPKRCKTRQDPTGPHHKGGVPHTFATSETLGFRSSACEGCWRLAAACYVPVLCATRRVPRLRARLGLARAGGLRPAEGGGVGFRSRTAIPAADGPTHARHSRYRGYWSLRGAMWPCWPSPQSDCCDEQTGA